MITRWLARVPTWVWILIAVSQAITIVNRSYKLPQLDAMIQEWSSVPAFVDGIEDLERFRDGYQRELIFASILAPVSIILALWSWSRRRQIPGPGAPL